MAMMVMAGDKNRDRDENQGGDQTAPPPSFLPLQFVLDPIKPPAEVIVPFTSGSARFFRHKLFNLQINRRHRHATAGGQL